MPNPRPDLVIGVDPGGRQAGIVTRTAAGDVVFARVLDRPPGMDRPTWAKAVAVAVDTVRDDALAHDLNRLDYVPVGVEDVQAPNPHVRRRDGNSLTNLDGILDTAVVLGALILGIPDLVVVPPAGHGSAPIPSYPAELRPTTGNGRGRDRLRHARSAYDVAGAALFQHRTGGHR